MLNLKLKKTVNLAFRLALSEHHEFITIEHLALALLQNEEAADVLYQCGADLKKLYLTLNEFLQQNVPLVYSTQKADLRVKPETEQRCRPTVGFERVMQRALFLSECAEHKQVSAPHVLMAIFGELDCFSAFAFKQQNIGRNDIAYYLRQSVLAEQKAAKRMSLCEAS